LRVRLPTVRAAHQTVTITMEALHAKANPTADELVIPKAG